MSKHAAIALYAGCLSLVNATGALAWVYASRRRLVAPGLPAPFARAVAALHAAPVAVYALAALVGFWFSRAALAVFALVPAFFILPNPALERSLREARAASGKGR